VSSETPIRTYSQLDGSGNTFTDQKPFVVDAKALSVRWSCRQPGEGLRCYLCGHRFEVGDVCRWVYAGEQKVSGRGLLNFLTCKDCDGPDILARWVAHCEILEDLYWWAI